MSDQTESTDVIDIRDAGEDRQALGAPTLDAALESLLILADDAIPGADLAEIVGRPQQEVSETLIRLAAGYLAAGRGFELRLTDDGWRFYSATICRDLVSRYVTDGRQARLSQAALETLAIVAYRQPVTRSQVGAVRGVNADGVIKTLEGRGLIRESTDQGVARFVTTPYFLDRMGIGSLSDLPPIAEHLPDFSVLDDLVDE